MARMSLLAMSREQASRNRHFGQLKGDVAAMSNNLGTDLEELLPQRGQRPVLDLLRQYRLPLLLRVVGRLP